MDTSNNLDNSKEVSRNDDSINLLLRHLSLFVNNDLQALLLDYTDKSVFITQDATFIGVNEIKGFFSNLLVHFPKAESKFTLDKLAVKDELGFIIWHAETPSLVVPLGTDTFIIKDGKISQQTFVGQMNYINRQP
jgi:hypothetical protein